MLLSLGHARYPDNELDQSGYEQDHADHGPQFGRGMKPLPHDDSLVGPVLGHVAGSLPTVRRHASSDCLPVMCPRFRHKQRGSVLV
jgi:hypothetical protein